MNENKLRNLKNEGHLLLDQYKEITGSNSKKAYEVLKERMKGKAWHFGSMNQEQDIKLAIGNIKKMIASEKYKNKTPGADLP